MTTLSEIIKAHEEDTNIMLRDFTPTRVLNMLDRESTLLSLVERMRPYMKHQYDCQFYGHCACGLNKLLDELK